MRKWWRANWLWLWLSLCALLLVAAPLKRHLSCLALGRQLAAQLESAAEGKSVLNTSLLEAYLWGDYSSGAGAVQGPAIWLLRQGYANRELLGGILLAESQRLYEHIYTYPRVLNADLRAGLIRRCLAKELPASLDLTYAAGRLALAQGQTDEAVALLETAQSALPRWELSGYPASRLPVPDARHVLGRYCAALTLSGRDSEAGALLAERTAQRSRDSDYAWVYAHWLADHGRWDEVLPLCVRFRDVDPRGDWNWLERNARLYRGELQLYRGLLSLESLRLGELAVQASDQWSAQDYQASSDRVKQLWQGLYDTVADPAASRDPDALWRAWLLSGEEHYLQRLTMLSSELDASWTGPEADWEAREDWQRRRFACGMWLAMARIRQGRWSEAQSELGKIGPGMFWDEAADRDWQEQALICRIALVEPLGAPFALRRGVDNREEWDPKFMPRADAAAATDAADDWIDTSLIQPPGLFSELRSGDRLTALLRSPDFAAALKHSGHTLADELPEVLRVTQPALERYNDWSNGELPEGWR